MGLISIITPCFNSEKHISETIDSVINQTYTRWEMICVDDGSFDNTCAIIERYSKDHENIKLVRRNNQINGGSVCRNIGIVESKGDYLIFLDADDVLSADCLMNRIREISKSNLNFVVFPNATIYNGVVRKITSDARVSKPLLAYCSNHAVWQTTGPIYRKTFVESVGGFDERFKRLQDVEFGLRCIAFSDNNYRMMLRNMNPDCYYRLGDVDVMSKKYEIAYSMFPLFTDLVYRIFSEKKLSNAEFSRVCLCLICSIIIVSSITKDKQPYNNVFNFNVEEYMRPTEMFVLKILNLFRGNWIAYKKIAHGVKYVYTRVFF